MGSFIEQQISSDQQTQEKQQMDLNTEQWAIDGWWLYFTEQEQDLSERADQYRERNLPPWLIQGIEWRFASLPARVVTME